MNETMAGGRKPSLYTPAVLAAAIGLAAWPWDDALPLKGMARSRTCGSTLDMGLALDPRGRICAIGVRTHACAIGQASAHAFASGAIGKDPATIGSARAAIAAWLDGRHDLGDMVLDWPGLAVIAPARAFPSRHGAIMLAWDAAVEALPD